MSLSWNEKINLAQSINTCAHSYYRNNHMVVYLYGKTLVKPVEKIIHLHYLYHKSLEQTLSQLQSLSHLSYCEIELTTLQTTSPQYFIPKSLQTTNFLSSIQPRDVILYGFGRIGRMLTRLIFEINEFGLNLQVRAIVVRLKKEESIDTIKRMNLLNYDSIHGTFKGYISIQKDYIQINDQRIYLLFETEPQSINYSQYGIQNAILIDNTGIFRDKESLSRHLANESVSSVIVTAPGKDIPNLVYGINSIPNLTKFSILSAASCTTNAIVPIVSFIHKQFTIIHGHIETIHSYTNDQNLLDNYHKKWRRCRSAALNLVLTETGAAKAVEKCLPQLAGKFTANAIRVPTPNVSMAILSFDIDINTTKQEVNTLIQQESIYGTLFKQIEYYDFPDGVSSDFIGNKHTSIIDAQATIVNNKKIRLYVWYDNEFSYSCQVLRIADEISYRK